MNSRFTIFTLFAALTLSSCVSEHVPTPQAGKGTLVLSDVSRVQAEGTPIVTRAVDADLAVEILDEDGTPREGMVYAAGAVVPDKLLMPVGNYQIHAYSENQTSWRTENGGLGGPVYDVTQSFAIEADWITYLDVAVPMLNYGITYSLPDNFAFWFPTAEFTVNNGTLSLSPGIGETAYFDPNANDTFTFSLHLINTDGEEYTTEAHTFEHPKAGHLYEVHYSFVSEDDPSHLRINITYEDNFFAEGESMIIDLDNL